MNAGLIRFLDRSIEFLLYLTIAVVPLVYYNNPIATEYFFSKALYFDLFVYLGLALLFLRALMTNQLTVRWGLTFLPLALFCVVALQSLIGSTNFFKGWETVARVGAAVPFLFLLYQAVGTREMVTRMLVVAAVTNIAVTSYGFLQYFEVLPLPRDQYGTPDPSTTIGLTNFVMEYMAVFMFVMPAMVIVEKRRFFRAVFAAAALAQTFYFLISENRAAMVGLGGAALVVGLLLVLQYRRGTFRLSRAQSGLLAAVLALGLVVIALSPVGQRVYNRASSIIAVGKFDDAITFRLETWRQALKVFADNPVRGVGLSNLEVVFPLYQSPFLENMTLKKNTRVVRAHNEYIQVLADLGIIGGIVFLWFLLNILRLMARTYRKARAWDDLLLVTGLAGGVVAYLIIAIFAFPFEVPSSALSIMFTLGLLEIMNGRVLGEETAVQTYAVPRNVVAPASAMAMGLVSIYGVYSTTWMWRVLRAEVYFKEARVMKDFQQYDTARQLLDEAIRYYPQNEAYYYDRSIFSIRDRNLDEALFYLSKTAELVPNYGMGRKQLGMLYAQAHKFEQAAKEFEAAYRIYPSYHHEYVPLLVSAYIGYGDTKKAVETAQKAVEKAPKRPEVLFAAGQAYISDEKYDQAVTVLSAAATNPTKAQDAQVLLAFALIEANQPEKALVALEAVGNLSPKSTHKAMYDQARVKTLAALGRVDEAREALQALLATQPQARVRLAADPVIAKHPSLVSLLNP